MELTQAGRAVSLACFYLTLPAVFLLLGRLGLARAQRWVVLALVLTCPLYIYYARAFLIETMALMFSAWFLLAFLHAVGAAEHPVAGAGEPRRAGRGTGEGHDVHAFSPAGGRVGGMGPVQGAAAGCFALAGWIAAATGLPFAATLGWTSLRRRGQATESPSAGSWSQGSLTDFNFGTTVANRFLLVETLRQHWQHVSSAIMYRRRCSRLACCWR